jgi:hypothetical protein
MTEGWFALIGSILGGICSLAGTYFAIKYQFKTVAIDKRLSVYQEGYNLWCQLMLNLNDTTDAKNQLMLWWRNNCIFINGKVRIAFRDMMNSIGSESDDAFSKISNFGDIIENTFNIPSIK